MRKSLDVGETPRHNGLIHMPTTTPTPVTTPLPPRQPIDHRKLPSAHDIFITQSVYASVAHRYWNPLWTLEQNVNTYGRQASPIGIGSNMRVELCVPAQVGEQHLNRELEQLKTIVDHRCLFAAGAPFADTPSTLERMTQFLAAQIAVPWRSMKVWETERMACVIKAHLPGELTICMKLYNFWLEVTSPTVDPLSGLLMNRSAIESSLDPIIVQFRDGKVNSEDHAAWSENAFISLQRKIDGLSSLQIDLGRHEYLIVQSGQL